MQEQSGIFDIRNSLGNHFRRGLLSLTTLWKKVPIPFNTEGDESEQGKKIPVSNRLTPAQLISKTTTVFIDRMDSYGTKLMGPTFESRLREAFQILYERGAEQNAQTALDFRSFASDFFIGLDLSDNQASVAPFVLELEPSRNLLRYKANNEQSNVFLEPDGAVFSEFLCAIVTVPAKIDSLALVDEIDSVWMSSGVVAMKEKSIEISLPENFSNETLLVFTGQRYMNEYGEYLKEFDSMRCNFIR